MRINTLISKLLEHSVIFDIHNEKYAKGIPACLESKTDKNGIEKEELIFIERDYWDFDLLIRDASFTDLTDNYGNFRFNEYFREIYDQIIIELKEYKEAYTSKARFESFIKSLANKLKD